MRVITGTARGRRLKELQGMETRPTTDKVKESLFSIIQFDIEGRRVLDLFAGTGQLGIEALSRGAAEAVFVDRRPDAVRLVQENLALCGFTDRARVKSGDALAYLKSGEKFDLIFLDPPYAADLLEQALTAIASFDICREHGIIVAAPPIRCCRSFRRPIACIGNTATERSGCRCITAAETRTRPHENSHLSRQL
jgi:16S rRNA (guanine966-N2)-methyltransferase